MSLGCGSCHMSTGRDWRNGDRGRRRHHHRGRCRVSEHIHLFVLLSGWCNGCDEGGRCHDGGLLMFAHLVYRRPLRPLKLLQVHVLLLRADHASRSHDAHEGDGFRCCEAVLPYKICTNEGAGATQASFTLFRVQRVSHMRQRIPRLRTCTATTPPLSTTSSDMSMNLRTISSVGFVPSSK